MPRSFTLLDFLKKDFRKNGVFTEGENPVRAKASSRVRQFYQEDKIARREPRECRPKGEPQDVASDSPWTPISFSISQNQN
jgi:hypothetical protein